MKLCNMKHIKKKKKKEKESGEPVIVDFDLDGYTGSGVFRIPV